MLNAYSSMRFELLGVVIFDDLWINRAGSTARSALRTSRTHMSAISPPFRVVVVPLYALGLSLATRFRGTADSAFSAARSTDGLKAARYCASKARNAVSAVDPTPTTASSMPLPSSATHIPDRIDNSGRHAAAGLPGCAAKYSSARSFAAMAWSMSLCFIIVLSKHSKLASELVV